MKRPTSNGGEIEPRSSSMTLILRPARPARCLGQAFFRTIAKPHIPGARSLLSEVTRSPAARRAPQLLYDNYSLPVET